MFLVLMPLRTRSTFGRGYTFVPGKLVVCCTFIGCAFFTFYLENSTGEHGVDVYHPVIDVGLRTKF